MRQYWQGEVSRGVAQGHTTTADMYDIRWCAESRKRERSSTNVPSLSSLRFLRSPVWCHRLRSHLVRSLCPTLCGGTSPAMARASAGTWQLTDVDWDEEQACGRGERCVLC